MRGKMNINLRIVLIAIGLIAIFQPNVAANAVDDSVTGKTGAFIAGFEQLKQNLSNIQSEYKTTIDVQSEISVIPGGQSIGVLTYDKGVFVSGSYDVVNLAGEKINPANRAGVKAGDVILSIDGLEVNNDIQVKDLVTAAGNSGRAVSLQVKRGHELFNTTLEPVLCQETYDYRVGLLLKDSAAGVGTITFYEPESKIYGALGHVISNNNSSKSVDLSNGKVVGARIQGLAKGQRGQPGEKFGMIQISTNLAGTITQNTKLGIFGQLQEPLVNPFYTRNLPVAGINEIQTGPAEILTVLRDEQVEKFSVEIIKVYTQARQDGKGLIIKITDPRLLEETGGIIQGMSGSPIIQGDKLVGAVTHVFVNDPTRGYGVPVTWMLEEASLYGNVDENTVENTIKPAA